MQNFTTLGQERKKNKDNSGRFVLRASLRAAYAFAKGSTEILHGQFFVGRVRSTGPTLMSSVLWA